MSEEQQPNKAPQQRRGSATPHMLETISGPADLSGRSDEELAQISQEVRELIIDVIGEIGGHFGANLGTCELATVLHSLLDSPRDKILWDVGHQAYPHKVLTGRADRLPTIRQYEGLAPFCSVFESEHDIMGAGHASTSIGYAVGLKEAMRHGIGEDGKVVAVIGDGALTGGVAFEALHNAGGLQTPIVIVLNDNGMSISPNVGALSRFFQRTRLNPRLYHAREDVEEALTKLPLGLGRQFERLGPEIKSAIKAYAAPGLFFEELDLAYVGPVDGHDVTALRQALEPALAADRPVVVHIHTVKGKGFEPAEEGGLEGMEKWHAAKPGSIVGGKPAPKKPAAKPPLTRGEMVEGRRPEEAEQPAARLHLGVRRRARGRGEARPARDRDHRGDGGGDRPDGAGEGVPAAVLRRRHRRAGRGPVRRGAGAAGRKARLRDLLDLPAARLRPDSSTTSACRSSTSSSRWTAPGWSATTARRITAPSTSPTSARFPTWSLMAPRDEAMLCHMLRTALAYDDGPIAFRYPRGDGRGRAAPRSRARDSDRHRRGA